MRWILIIALLYLAVFGACGVRPQSRAIVSSVDVAPMSEHSASVTFAYRAEQAETKVFLAGDFNGWNPLATPLERMGDGMSRATVELTNGRHAYKFVVDGRWMSDPTNSQFEPDGHDGFNSIVMIGAANARAAPSVRERMTQAQVDAFHTPEWAKHAVWYQIMLDRFANGDLSNDPPNTRAWSSDWRALSESERASGQTFWEWAVFQRHYGGDLAGLQSRIPYLQALGVNALYLNPVFEAPSAHKYNASTYVHIDDAFGGKSAVDAHEDLLNPATWTMNASDRAFVDTLAQLHAAHFRVIIDGVFNHVGDTHEAFIDVRTNGARSRYADWFEIESFEPFTYRGWAGFGELPAFRKNTTGIASATATAHIMAITRRWMDPNGDGDPSDGVDGWRLDVPMDVPLGFWREWRALVKSINPDALIVGEIWTRADMWLDGSTFDAVMNYPFADALLSWVGDDANAISASALDQRLAILRDAYPSEATYALQNLVDSHDTDRLVSMLANPNRGYDRANSERAGSIYEGGKPSREIYRRARLVALAQMTSVGAPMLWYGDEVGMWGSDDPTCRKPMIWADGEANVDPNERVDEAHLAHYRAIIALRTQHAALRTGSFRTIFTNDAAKVWIFARELDGERIIVALNASASAFTARLGEKEIAGFAWSTAFESDDHLQLPSVDASGAITCTLPAHGGLVLVGTR